MPDECEHNKDVSGSLDRCTPACEMLLRDDVKASATTNVDDIALLVSILVDPTVIAHDDYYAADVIQDAT